jgi:hypothetical protein
MGENHRIYKKNNNYLVSLFNVDTILQIVNINIYEFKYIVYMGKKKDI